MNDEPQERDRRLEELESTVRGLAAEVAELRAEVQRAGGAAARPQPVVPLPLRKPEPQEEAGAGAEAGAASGGASGAGAGAKARPSTQLPPRTAVSGMMSGGLEQAIGRYGTLVVATLAILLGVGAFLQWAVARGLLGPEMRVVLGAIAAAVFAWLGLRLRTKGSATFGNALLAIALAITHLVAWGAGPVLEIVPPKLALAVAALASTALAVLALRSGEQILFLLGLGGALLAPFVTSKGAGDKLELLAFGFVVLSAAIYALRDPSWRAAPRLISPLALGYMVAAAGTPRRDYGIGAVYWPTAFALLLAIVALVVGAKETRRGLVRTMLFLVAVGIIIAGGYRYQLPWTGIAYGLLGTLTVHALRRRTALADPESKDTWVEVVGIPLLLLFTVLFVEDTWKKVEGAPIALAWLGIAAAFLFVDRPTSRARHLTVMMFALMVVAANLYHGDEVGIVPAFAVVAALSVYAFHRVPGYALLLPIGLALLFGTLRAYVLVEDRDAWVYAPFVNQAALAGLTVVASWLFLSWAAPKAFTALEGERRPWDGVPFAEIFKYFGPVLAFLWIRAELAEAYSRDLATFLLISYYALTGVGTILAGRKLAIDGLRQAGLALSLFAAGKAVVGASDLDSIGLRVGSYLVVGVFLLGVGYLYRAKPGDGDDAAPPSETETAGGAA